MSLQVTPEQYVNGKAQGTYWRPVAGKKCRCGTYLFYCTGTAAPPPSFKGAEENPPRAWTPCTHVYQSTVYKCGMTHNSNGTTVVCSVASGRKVNVEAVKVIVNCSQCSLKT